MEVPAEFEFITNRFVVGILTHCAMLFGNTFWKEIKIFMPSFIVYFYMKYVTIWMCSIPPNTKVIEIYECIHIRVCILCLLIHHSYREFNAEEVTTSLEALCIGVHIRSVAA